MGRGMYPAGLEREFLEGLSLQPRALPKRRVMEGAFPLPLLE